MPRTTDDLAWLKPDTSVEGSNLVGVCVWGGGGGGGGAVVSRQVVVSTYVSGRSIRQRLKWCQGSG